MANKLQRVVNWLEGNRDYNTGLDLYQQYGTNQALLSVLNLGESSFTRPKLEQALKDLVTKHQVKAQEYHPPKEANTYKRIDVEALPKPLKRQWEDIFLPTLTKAKHIHPKLCYMEGPQKDRAVAEMVELLRANRGVLANIDRWQETGILDDDSISRKMHERYVFLLKEALNLRNYLSRYKNDANRAEEVKRRLEYKKEIEQIIEHGGLDKI